MVALLTWSDRARGYCKALSRPSRPHGKHTPQRVGKGAEEDDALECGRVALHEGTEVGAAQRLNHCRCDDATGPAKAQRPAFA